MNPQSVQMAGVILGWLLFAATVVPIVLRRRARSAARVPSSLFAVQAPTAR